MAVQAKQLPIAAIWWVVVMVVIAVMDGEFVQVCPSELALAAPAYPGIHLERLFPVILFSLFSVAPGAGHDLL